jgi:hypothetical protein
MGAFTVGQLQLGEVTSTILVQPFKVDVSVTFVPKGMPDTVFDTLSTVPVVEVTVPLLLNDIL